MNIFFRFYLQFLVFIVFYLTTALSIYLNRTYFTFLINLIEVNSSNVSTRFDCFNITLGVIHYKENEYCNCIYRDPIDPDRYVLFFF